MELTSVRHGRRVYTTNSPFGVNATGGISPIVGSEGALGGAYTGIPCRRQLCCRHRRYGTWTHGSNYQAFSARTIAVRAGVFTARITSLSGYSGIGTRLPRWRLGRRWKRWRIPGHRIGVNATADIWCRRLRQELAATSTPPVEATNNDPNGYPLVVGNTTNDPYCAVDGNGNL